MAIYKCLGAGKESKMIVATTPEEASIKCEKRYGWLPLSVIFVKP